MSNTFSKLQKRIENSDGTYTFEPLSYVGVEDVPLGVMKGASSSSDGEIGLVPKPTKGNQNKFLSASGEWLSISASNGTVDIPTYNGTNNGLVPKTDKSSYFLMGNGSWGYPWVGSWTENNKVIICLGSNDDHLSTVEIPEATTTQNGLLSKDDKAKIDTIGTMTTNINNNKNNISSNATKITNLTNDMKSVNDRLNEVNKAINTRMEEFQKQNETTFSTMNEHFADIEKELTKINDKIAKYHK